MRALCQRPFVILIVGGLALSGCRDKPAKPARLTKQKVLVMGFDGMDPTLARRFMDEGKLPNLKRLAEAGTFATLGSTQPSESPTAWSSFATSVNPGKHNIYDFLVRSFDTYEPNLGMVKTEEPEFLWGTIPIKRPKIISTRGGTSFWVHAGHDGVRTIVLTVPVTFPPEKIEHGDMLSGLPLPDIRGHLGTFSYWATDLTSFEEANPSEFGGNLKGLVFKDGRAETYLRGPTNPILKQEERAIRERAKPREGQEARKLTESEEKRLAEIAKTKDVNLPVEVLWTRGTGAVEVHIADAIVKLKTGEWSDWVPLTFKMNMFLSVHGMTQFHLIRGDEELQLYASPVNWDPRNPPMPISKPDEFSRELTNQIGLYRTLGWAESADKALNDGRLDEGAFLYDSYRAMEDRERIIFKNLERTDWDLFVAVIETTDRISHMMWRLIDPRHPMYDAKLAAKYGDSIEKVYRRADDVVGRIVAKMPPDTVLLVVSDHGFHSFRRGVNINTWLYQNHYLVSTVEDGPEKTLEDLFGHGGGFWQGVDWSHTRAYAVGLGQIYFNLRGREKYGIVSPGAEYKALQDEIAAKLVTVTDPDDGAPVMRSVYRRDEMYTGSYLVNAPDLQVAFNDGYRVGWQDTLGRVQRAIVENNNRKWSGDHCATAAEISGGVLFSNRKVERTPNIMDVGPTVLKLLDVPLPPEIDGRPLL